MNGVKRRHSSFHPSLFLLLTALGLFWISPLAAQEIPLTWDPARPVFLSKFGKWQYLAAGTQADFPIKPPGDERAWRPFDKITVPEQEAGLDFWFRRPLPKFPWPEASYLVQSDAPAFAVYLDSIRIYSYGKVAAAAAGKPEGFTLHSIPLPPGYQEKTLSIWLPNCRAFEVSFWRSLIVPKAALPRAIRTLLISYLASDLIGLILGGMFSLIGLAIIAFYALRGRWRDVAVLSFGIYALLCGLSFLPVSYVVQFLFPTPNVVWWQVSAVISYLYPIPITLFILQLSGRGWHSSLLWTFWFLVAYAAFGLASDFLLQIPNSLARANHWVVSGLTWLVLLVILVNLFRPSQKRTRETVVLLAGFGLFSVALIAAHLAELKVFSLRFNPVPLGNLLFVCCVGYLAAKNYLTRERKLATIEHEIQTARRIQSAILPQQVPQVSGLDIAVRYIPTTTVAGDFYDFLVLDQTHLGILVADVSGHGVPAALIASMVKASYTTQTLNASNPARILSEMNQALLSNPEGQFITAACLYVDIEKRKMVYAGAGHPPLYIWRRSEGQYLEFANNGLIMGPFPEASYENAEMALKPGDRFILYTDGITETMNASGDLFGEERLKEFIRTHADLPVGAFAEAFIESLLAWSGKKTKALDDDLTLIVVDVTFKE
jgi:sigma-B regulation protein RsbU (phosphoserine phosphatase)